MSSFDDISGVDYVMKRDGRKEEIHFDKITSRIKKLCYGLDAKYVQAARITQKARPDRV